MCKVSKLIRNGLAIAAGIAAYQAAQKTRLETGSFYGDTFGRNFKDQLIANAKLVADFVRKKLSRQSVGALPEESGNGGNRADAEPAEDKVKAQESAEGIKELEKKAEKKTEKKAKKKAKKKVKKKAKEEPEKKAPDKEDKGQAQP